MTLLLVVAIAQLADLVTFLIASTLHVGHEGNFAAHVESPTIVVSKALVAAIITGLWVFRHRPRPDGKPTRPSYIAFLAFLMFWTAAVGVVGTATNIVNGGIL